MKDHVPDLERCKRLQEKGFPQDLQFFWATDWCDAWWVVHETDLGCNDMPIAAPIVTELVEEIQNVCSAITTHWMDISILSDGHSFVRIVAHEGVQWGNDTLPNALADLWIWLRERGE